jgi:hypothetical protein
MNASTHFSATYAEARTRFIDTCAALGLAVERHLHPERGREGEELATDVARLGAADAGRVLITMSATHGVEGFCGSGVQVGALRSGLYDELPDDVAVVLIHAINPFGFSWLRRVTHENVDLNRNHLDHGAPYPLNEGYEDLRDAICPRHWNEESRAATKAVFDAYAREHGPMALQTAFSRGQYSHPRGLFYGGNSTTWSASTLASVVSRHAAAARHVGFIDYHTGLGPYGYGELISDHQLGEPGHGRLVEWLGADQVTSTDDGSSTSAPLVGTNNMCVSAAISHASLTMLTLEFGTSPVEEVIDSLRADCWLHNHGNLDSEQGRAIKAEIRRCFYPDADDWKTMIRERASDTERRMIAGLSSLD